MIDQDSSAPPPDAPRPVGAADPDDDAPQGPAGVPWTIPEAAAVFIANAVVVGVVVGLLAYLQGVNRSLADTITLPAQVLPPAVLTVTYIALRHGKQAFTRLLGRRPPTWADVGYGIAVGVGTFLVVNLGVGGLVALFAREIGADLPEVQEQLREVARDPALRPSFLLATVVLGPVAEELYYRGMLFQTLRRRLWRWPAIGISAIVFSIVHVEPLAVALTLGAGMCFAWAFARRGTIVTSMFAHAVFNLVATLGIILGLG